MSLRSKINELKKHLMENFDEFPSEDLEKMEQEYQQKRKQQILAKIGKQHSDLYDLATSDRVADHRQLLAKHDLHPELLRISQQKLANIAGELKKSHVEDSIRKPVKDLYRYAVLQHPSKDALAALKDKEAESLKQWSGKMTDKE